MSLATLVGMKWCSKISSTFGQMSSRSKLLGIWLSIMASSATAHADFAFLTPSGWSAEAAGSTYQEWSVLTSTPMIGSNPNFPAPDAGYAANPAIPASPTIGVALPGFSASSGNFYSFSDTYSWFVNVPNHGETGGGSYPSNIGTHVIVQTAATLNPDFNLGVVDNSLQIVDLNGNPIPGGDNGDALRVGPFYIESGVPSLLGPVDYQGLIWEFFLPNYTGDFRVEGSSVVHSSLDMLRIDSMLSAVPFAETTIPEPMASVLFAIGIAGVGGLYWGRRRVTEPVQR